MKFYAFFTSSYSVCDAFNVVIFVFENENNLLVKKQTEK